MSLCSKRERENYERKCKKCKAVATWEVEVTQPGSVSYRNEVYYACANCRNAVAKIRSIAAEFRSI